MLHAFSSVPSSGNNWAERVLAPIKFGFKELVPTALKLGSALTVTVAGRQAVQQLGGQLVARQLRY